MKYAITGASGQLGGAAATWLLKSVSPGNVVLISRSPEKLEHFKQLGVQVLKGDFLDPASLAAAFAGIDRLLVVSAMPPGNTVAMHTAAFDSAERAGIGHVVYTSFPNPVEENMAPPADSQRKSELALRSSGLAWTILRNALYADLRVRLVPTYLKEGGWVTNCGGGAHAFVRRDDCARAAVAALLQAEALAGETLDITGPELIAPLEFAGIVKNETGRDLPVLSVDDEHYSRHFSAFIAEPANAGLFDLFPGTGTAIRKGLLSQISDDFRRLTGQRPGALNSLVKAEVTSSNYRHGI